MLTMLSHILKLLCSCLLAIIKTKMANICDRILEKSSKSHMKSSVFLHIFNDISTYVYVFMEYFLYFFSNLSIEFLVVLLNIIENAIFFMLQ